MSEKDPVERIVIMQSRLNAMRKLYSKLRAEVASIDRRKTQEVKKTARKQTKRNSVNNVHLGKLKCLYMVLPCL